MTSDAEDELRRTLYRVVDILENGLEAETDDDVGYALDEARLLVEAILKDLDPLRNDDDRPEPGSYDDFGRTGPAAGGDTMTRKELDDAYKALWSEQGGVDPETGERWLTPASQEEASQMALRAMDGFRLRAVTERDALLAKLAAAEAILKDLDPLRNDEPGLEVGFDF